MLVTLISSAILTGFLAMSGWLLIPLALSYGLIAVEQADTIYSNAFALLISIWILLNLIPFCLIMWHAYASDDDKEE
ncbi:hypothetical protein [Cohaesibacter celericrescens]|uniref:Uncharacterized protein n=1 Tax=Cohaesibacter celericrescens TaxID=2067669 RepID=A0A2N5XQI9_9HYPH|nr:hypothetical protein [Cohaesibacter celericrescens]PLW76792.1 hypothetical protein C0081_12075 [Cohaesibacter celericrescens]